MVDIGRYSQCFPEQPECRKYDYLQQLKTSEIELCVADFANALAHVPDLNTITHEPALSETPPIVMQGQYRHMMTKTP